MLELISGTTTANKIQQAQQALERGDYDHAAELYTQILERLNDSGANQDVRRAIWLEHVGVLIANEQLTRAIQQLDIYLPAATASNDLQAVLELNILLAESLVARNDWDCFREILGVIRAMLDDNDLLQKALASSMPQLSRLFGLDAAERGNTSQAQALLLGAKEGFAALQYTEGVQLINSDLRLLALKDGNADVLDEILDTTDFNSTYEILIYARALRRDARYEAAIQVIQKRLEHYIEPPLRFPILHELILLYQILANREMVEKLLPMLEEAVPWTSDPTESNAIVNRLSQHPSQKFSCSKGQSFESRLHNARALIQQQKHSEADLELERIHKMAKSPRLLAYWMLAAGELALSRGILQPHNASRYGNQALDLLNQASKLSWQYSIPEVYVESRRLIGRTYALVYTDLETAAQYWAGVSRTEELIAHRQETDMARIRYLEAAPTQNDELIESTAVRVTASNNQLFASGIIAAMEIARGATILSLILPASSQRLRDVPQPYEFDACLNWYAQMTMSLPNNLAVWILHNTPDAIHHGIIAKGILHWSSHEIDRFRLHKSIDKLNEYWISKTVLENLIQTKPDLISRQIQKIARQLSIQQIISILPQKISRLAIVAGGALAEIPFAALPISEKTGQVTPLVSNFAISYLPCISAYNPLADRAKKGGGNGGIIVHPPASEISQPKRRKNFKVLEGEQATISEFESRLLANAFPIVRIDCHGTYDDESGWSSWLQLAPDSEEGRLSADRFQDLSFDNCGTLLLGACESGMAKRVGRDERLGFVRTAFAAGASSVIAARWIAEERAASFILDRFQHYLRFMLKDQALQRAQLDYIEGSKHSKSGDYFLQQAHPARWACWSLYGDANLQTNSNWITLLGCRLANKIKSVTSKKDRL